MLEVINKCSIGAVSSCDGFSGARLDFAARQLRGTNLWQPCYDAGRTRCRRAERRCVRAFDSPYLDRPLLPLAVAPPRMLEEIEAELATAAPYYERAPPPTRRVDPRIAHAKQIGFLAVN